MDLCRVIYTNAITLTPGIVSVELNVIPVMIESGICIPESCRSSFGRRSLSIKLLGANYSSRLVF